MVINGKEREVATVKSEDGWSGATTPQEAKMMVR
jgi:hypothetical protein